MKKIRELQLNESVNMALIVISALIKYTSQGKKYLALKFFDGETYITGNVWNYTDEQPIPTKRDIVNVEGTTTQWNNSLQIDNLSWHVNNTYKISDFLVNNELHLSDKLTKLHSIAMQIKDGSLRNITIMILKKELYACVELPAAIYYHHNYPGGLVIHTLGVVNQAISMANNLIDLMPYYVINMDLIIAGSILHDIGKTVGYTYDITPDITDTEILQGHIISGIKILDKYKDTPNITNKAVIDLLQHIILSHHGDLQYGSPVTPGFMEAWIVHLADFVDSRLAIIEGAERDIKGNITEKVYALNSKNLYTRHFLESMIKGGEENGVEKIEK